MNYKKRTPTETGEIKKSLYYTKDIHPYSSDMVYRVDTNKQPISPEDRDSLYKTDRYTFEKKIQILDGRNIQLGKTNGTIIGTEGYGDATPTDAGQKLGFYGTPPVAQQAAITPPAGGATVDAECRSAVATIIIKLQNLGLIQ